MVDKKISNLSPGLRSMQTRLAELSREVEKAVRAAEKHDIFINAAEKSTTLQVNIVGPRGGVSATFETSVPVVYEEVLGAVMRTLQSQVSEQYDKVKKLKEEL